jgi:N6-adenosine-specific RNA methylase IME4
MTWPFGTLTPGAYGLILADPPWKYELRSEAGHGRSPERHYRTWPTEEICALPVHELAAPDCLLVLWSTWPHLLHAQRVMRAWGFRYVTGGAWTKRYRSGAPAMGGGFIFRSTTEPYLVGTAGSPWIGTKSERNYLETIEEVVEEGIDGLRRGHSRKPPEIRAMCERLAPSVARCELFATEGWPGADVWGDQIGKWGTP